MKLLIVTQKVDKNDENLGAFYYWFEEFAKKFEMVFIIANSAGVSELPANVVLASLGKEKKSLRLVRYWRFLRLFAKYYRKSDIVFFHMIPEFILAASPFLIFSRRRSALWYAHKSVTWKLKIAEKLVDYIFSSSEAGFRLPSRKVIFTGQAINTEIFYPPSEKSRADDTIRFLSIGRISPVKNFETIIMALKILKDSWPKRWTLSIVGGPAAAGDRGYLNLLEKMIGEKGLAGLVRFWGPRPYPRLPEILREHDFLINVSKTGSLDKVVLEAMACGLTVLTSTEGYRAALPARYFLENHDPVFIAERIKLLAEEKRPNMALRDIVIKNHDLRRTMEKIISTLLGK